MAKIIITLKSDLCAGSGESLGNVVDTDMCVDAFGLPVIPGRRIKGCLREAANTLKEIDLITDESINKLFGNELNAFGALDIGNAELENVDELRAWLNSANAEKVLYAPSLVSGMFTNIRGQTKMNEGVADSGSLRFTRVLNHISPMTGEDLCMVAPVSLYGECISEKEFKCLVESMGMCCKALRHMGMHRNRGLGRVSAEYIPDEGNRGQKSSSANQTGEENIGGVMNTAGSNLQQSVASPSGEGGVGTMRLFWRVALDANLVLTGADGQLTAIPGRSVIGSMASAWSQQEGIIGREDTFERLFLSGETQWSDLTPVIDGNRSEPAPLMLAYLKNREMYGNRLADVRFNTVWKAEKQKTVEGKWAVCTSNGWRIASVGTDAQYHHRHGAEDKALYSHTSVPAGLIYGGIVTAPRDLENVVIGLLKSARLRFGHSRNAQYARCVLWPDVEKAVTSEVADAVKYNIKAGQPVYVLLASNLLLSVNGRYALNNAEIRAQIAEALNKESNLIKDACPKGCIDYAQYTTMGGYQAMWGLQKPRVSAVAGGSVFCFIADADGRIPSEFRLGEYQQEGMGLCRVMSDAEMSLTIDKGSVDTRYTMGDKETEAQRNFRVALLKHAAAETVPASAVALFAKAKRNGDYGNLDYGRLRTMLEEADSLDDLLTNRVESVKTTSKQNAMRSFVETVCGKEDGTELLARLLCGANTMDEQSPKTANALMDGFMRLGGNVVDDFCAKNWKRLLSLALRMSRHASKEKTTEPKQKEAQA